MLEHLSIGESDRDPHYTQGGHKFHDRNEDDCVNDNGNDVVDTAYRHGASDDHDDDEESAGGETSDEESAGGETSDEESSDQRQNYGNFALLPSNIGNSIIAISANIERNARRWDGIRLIEAIRAEARTTKESIVVHYYFAENMERKEKYKKVVREAIREIEEAAPCIKFKNSREARNRIRIRYSSKGESSSAVGMRGGRQTLTLGWSTKGNALHELMHALGFLHQHQREDRSLYVSVRESKKNGTAYRKEGFNTGGRYDANSIMHYPCGTDMRDVELWSRHNKESLSNGDKIALNVLYPPVKGTRGWHPRKGDTGLYYCGKQNMKDNNAPFGKVGTDGFCGPDNGPNCHICRCYGGILERQNDRGHPAKQGETGLFYCSRKIKKTETKQGEHDGFCGPDNGPNCESCSKLLE